MIATYLSPELLDILQSIGWFAGAYLLGSIPVAWLLARWITGRDLRRMGSGNVGVMNTALSVARWVGLLVFMTEITKGLLAVTLPRMLGADQAMIGLAVLAAVIGTRWPIWLRFKGGRGNTTGMAALLLISYQSLLVMLAFWVLVRLIVKNSFTASRVTLLSLPLIILMVTHSWWFALIGLALCLIYLNAQKPDSDDHLIIQQHWSSFWDFLTSPPRR
jgi:acyl phosphate:glycerol-3-phosphate acyltransferase